MKVKVDDSQFMMEDAEFDEGYAESFNVEDSNVNYSIAQESPDGKENRTGRDSVAKIEGYNTERVSPAKEENYA